MHTSTDAIQVIGCTYRQLDHLTRSGVVPDGSGVSCPGPGGRRLWSRQQVERLAVAHQLAATGTASAFPDIARAALDAGPPPRQGYAVYGCGWLRWARTWADLRGYVDRGDAVVVVAYDLDALPVPELADA